MIRHYRFSHDIELDDLRFTVQAVVAAQYSEEEPDSPEGVLALEAQYELPEDILEISDELDLYIRHNLLEAVEFYYKEYRHD